MFKPPVICLALFLAACTGGIPDTQPGLPCTNDDQCDPGDVCSPNNHCKPGAAEPDAGPGSTPAGHLALSPSSAQVTVAAGATPPAQSFNLQNDGGSAMHYTLSCTGSAAATPSSGSLAVNETKAISVTLAPFASGGTSTVTCSAATADGSGAPVWTLTATVQQGTLTESPAAASADATVNVSPGSRSFVVENTGSAALHYAVACSTGLTPTPASGTLATGQLQTVAVALPTYATTGTRTLSCSVTTSDGAGSGTWTLTLNVQSGAVQVGHLSLTPATATVTVAAGTAPPAQSFTLQNDGNAQLSWNLSCSGGTPTPATGTLAASATKAVSVAIPAWTTGGSKTVTCTATTSDGTGAPSWTLTATVNAGQLTAAPATASTNATAGVAPSAQSFTLQNSGSAVAAFTVSCTANATPAPASGSLNVGQAQSIAVTLPIFYASGAQTVTCTAASQNGAGSATWTLTVNVAGGTNTGVGPHGGTVDLLDFAFTGDTRPTSCDNTSGYPQAAFQGATTAMLKLNPQFALDLGDHMFVCSTGSAGLSLAQAQMKLYTDALSAARSAAGWSASNLWFMTYGNHECGQASNNSGTYPFSCAVGSYPTTDANYLGWIAPFKAVSQQAGPNYAVDIQTRFGLVRLVVLADNFYTQTDIDWADATLTDADAHAYATIIARHHTVSGTRTGPTWPFALFDKHKATVMLVAHDHTYSTGAYSRTSGGTSVPAVVCGLGAANTSHVGFCRMQQQTDGSLRIQHYDAFGNPQTGTYDILTVKGQK